MNRTPHCPHCGFGTEEVESYICEDCANEPGTTFNHMTFNEWHAAANFAGFAGSREDAYDQWDEEIDPTEAGAEYNQKENKG